MLKLLSSVFSAKKLRKFIFFLAKNRRDSAGFWQYLGFRKLRPLFFAFFCVLFSIAISCSSNSTGTISEPEFPESNLSWQVHIRPILLNNCAVIGCHDSATRQNGLDFSMNPPSFQNFSGELVVIPFNSTQSRLFRLLFNGENGIPRMPKDRSALFDSERTAIGTWIDEGANTAN